jgi:hypothetical protein
VFGWQALTPLAVRRAAAESLDDLRAALEQPEQEPVAWMTPRKDIITCNGAGTRFNDWIPLYTHPIVSSSAQQQPLERK